MSETTRLEEIEARYQALDPGPWVWRQCYGIGNRVHWALESPKSAAEGKVVSYLAVLYHALPKSLGEPVEDDPYLRFMAQSRDDIEWLCQQLRRAESADHAALTKRVADLEETLAFAAQYKGIEARACPLCHYENGVFVDRCQMHKDMDALTKQVAELEAALAAATRYVPVEDGEYEGVQILEDGTFISFRDRDELGQPCWSAYTLGDLVVCRVAGKGKNE